MFDIELRYISHICSEWQKVDLHGCIHWSALRHLICSLAGLKSNVLQYLVYTEQNKNLIMFLSCVLDDVIEIVATLAILISKVMEKQ